MRAIINENILIIFIKENKVNLKWNVQKLDWLCLIKLMVNYFL